MRMILAAAALLAAFSAHAEVLTARNGGDSVRLTDEPCNSAVLAEKMPLFLREQFKAGTAIVDGQTYTVCWRWAGDDAHLLYEDGDQGIIPRRLFKPEIDA